MLVSIDGEILGYCGGSYCLRIQQNVNVDGQILGYTDKAHLDTFPYQAMVQVVRSQNDGPDPHRHTVR